MDGASWKANINEAKNLLIKVSIGILIFIFIVGIAIGKFLF